MLIYLDANIVQYCADYEDFIFGEITGKSDKCPVLEPKLRRELYALRTLVYWEQLGNWVFACTPDLIQELHNGNPTNQQRSIYRLLLESWQESEWEDSFPLKSKEVQQIDNSLKNLNLRDDADRRHLAEAIILKASWFLTNDREIIKKYKNQNLTLKVSLPSECLKGISVGLFLI